MVRQDRSPSMGFTFHEKSLGPLVGLSGLGRCDFSYNKRLPESLSRDSPDEPETPC